MLIIRLCGDNMNRTGQIFRNCIFKVSGLFLRAKRTPLKPLQIVGWIFQLFGVGILFIAIFTDLGPRYGNRYIVVYFLLAYVFIAYGRRVYLPEVKLLKPCPHCDREIKLTNRICPYCNSDLHVTSRFPGIGENEPIDRSAQGMGKIFH